MFLTHYTYSRGIPLDSGGIKGEHRLRLRRILGEGCEGNIRGKENRCLGFVILRRKLSRGKIQDETFTERGEMRMFGFVVLAAAWAPGLLTVVTSSVVSLIEFSNGSLYIQGQYEAEHVQVHLLAHHRPPHPSLAYFFW